MTRADVLTAAREAYEAGLSIVPPLEDGSKRPLAAWKQYQSARADKTTLRGWWGEATGLGVVCGAVSGSLEALDFDERDAYDDFVTSARAAGLGDLIDRLETGYVEDTPRQGVHYLYRCEEIAGNLKLASRPTRAVERRDPDDKIKTIIETRGEGGYLVLAPSYGTVHDTGRPYVRRAGGFATIPTLTPDERRDLHRVARTLDRIAKPPREHAPAQPATSDRPGDEYAARTDWAGVLEPAGWAHVFDRGEVSYWRRPGKAHGISATTNFANAGLLIVFSSSTPFETGRGYGKFGAYAVLQHGGDYRAAALALSAQGYGATERPREPGQAAAPGAQAPPATGKATIAPVLLRDVLHKLTAQIEAGRPPVVPTPFQDLNYLFNGGFAPGELVYLGARPGVGKTALALEIARRVARTQPVLFVSREMVNVSLARRMVAQDGRISASDLRRHQIAQSDLPRFCDSLERLGGLKLWLTDEASSVADLDALAAAPPQGDPWRFIVVDYLQLVRAPMDLKDRRLQVEYVSQGLKAIAVRHEIPVLCLTSLRRPQQGNARPTTADLRESGELEHDADIIILLHREEHRGDVVEAHVAKNRDGEIGTRDLLFRPQFVSFSSIDSTCRNEGGEN